MIVDHDYHHAATEKEGLILLKKGYHKIRVEYLEMVGGQFLKVSWKVPGGKKEEIKKNILFHE